MFHAGVLFLTKVLIPRRLVLACILVNSVKLLRNWQIYDFVLRNDGVGGSNPSCGTRDTLRHDSRTLLDSMVLVRFMAESERR